MNIFNNYRYLINLIKDEKYHFADYNNFNSYKRCVILRHDIDSSPALALKMAKMEYELEIKSTYFLMIRSPFYNLFSRVNNDIVKNIIDLGHNIALHYDEGYYAKDVYLQELINEEIHMLEKNFSINIDTVSFHQPSGNIINNHIPISQINTYDKIYFKNVEYMSDSNMIFHENLLNAIKKHKYDKIQLLIHPIWWMINGKNTKEKFINTIKLNFENEQKQIVKTERKYGLRKNISFKED